MAMGAGGSVYLTTGTITGTGTIRAHGGKSSITEEVVVVAG